MIKLAKNNPIIKDIKELQKKTVNDLVYVDDLSSIKTIEGTNNVIDTFIYCDELQYHDDTKKLIDALIKKAHHSYTISKQTYEYLRQKENTAGLICTVLFKNHILDDFKNKEFIVVCDRLEIPGNIGTIYRTMDATKAEAMILVDAVVKPQSAKLALASRGANFLLPTASASYEETIKWLLENNYTIFLGEPNLGKSYREYNYQGKIAIVVGSERFGINPDWYNHKHEKVFIPMYGSNNSLNVGVAASILIYEATMRRQKNKLGFSPSFLFFRIIKSS